MLTGRCIHPELLAHLARCGHGSRILIADGNYPLAEKCGGAARVYLGLTAGTPTVTEVLSVLHGEIEIEKAEVMLPDDGREPEIYSEFRRELNGLALNTLGRFEFYDSCTKQPLVLAISTGEQRTYACIILTVGCA